MADVIEYRGPDDAGMCVSGSSGLAMRRLSIIELEQGRQPIHNGDLSVHLVFDGEIYNYRALSDRLRSRGDQFATDSDTEVAVHAFEEWGTGSRNQLRGDGGDEMFVGYTLFRGVELARHVHSFHPTVRRFVASLPARVARIGERALQAFLRDHARGTRNLGAAIWSLLIFELWCWEILD